MSKKSCAWMMASALLASAVWLAGVPGQADRRAGIYETAVELERLATNLAQDSYEHFKGWNGAISDEEQAILFKSEAFAASCRLFLKLAEGRSEYFREDFVRTNLFNAFTYLAGSFKELEEEMRRGNVMPYALSDCRKMLTRMEREFSQWPSAENPAYLDQKYVKARDASVYLIERKGVGNYIRLPFKNLESLWRYNYDRNRGTDPWKHLVEVPEETLERMRVGRMIDLTFEGRLIIEQSSRRNRPVYLIENGRKRPLTNAQIVSRFGGWSKVYEVPREVIDSYPEGPPIER